jgi:dihydrofolate reductase
MAKRKIVTFNNVSAEGYFTDADGKLDWVIPAGEVTAAAMAAAPNVEVMLFGRKTYQNFEAGWRDKDVDPHAGKATPESREMSAWINQHQKLVCSRTLKEVSWQNSRLLPDLDAKTIEAVKSEAGGDVIVFGSGQLVSRLTELGLIDEYTFVVNPVFVGSGRALIEGVRLVKLKLLEARAFERSGHVLARYGLA